MTELTLYTNPQSRGRIARWMLEEVGEPYNTEILAYGDEMKSAEFLSINPMGKVPALKHGTEVITEAAAICAYLADAFQEKHLAPSRTERASYYRWLFFAAGPIELATTVKTLGVESRADFERMLGYGTYHNLLDTLESWLKSNEYVSGSRFTAADVYVGSHVQWGTQIGTLEKRDALVDYATRMHSRPAAIRATAMDDALV